MTVPCCCLCEPQCADPCCGSSWGVKMDRAGRARHARGVGPRNRRPPPCKRRLPLEPAKPRPPSAPQVTDLIPLPTNTRAACAEAMEKAVDEEPW